jgi:predicted GIY-YIG superfamily endonuclease
MPSFVYLLRGTTGRHYLGSTGDLEARLAQHQRGHTHTTKRLGRPLTLVAARSFATREEARSRTSAQELAQFGPGTRIPE